MGASSENANLWAQGDAYEPYVGRWSRLVAREFITWIARPPMGRWLDVGCGTGALTGAILELAAPSAVVGVDSSAGFLASARRQVTDARASFVAGDAADLPVRSEDFDVVVSGLMLNFVADPASVMAEFSRAARPGGLVGGYVWDYAAGMQMMRRFWDVASAMDPAAGELDEGRRFRSVCHPDVLADILAGAGLREVQVRAIDVPTVFRDFDDYWMPFLGGQGPAPGYVGRLDESRRAALRERLRAELPSAADGSIALTARAWAVRGER